MDLVVFEKKAKTT